MQSQVVHFYALLACPRQGQNGVQRSVKSLGRLLTIAKIAGIRHVLVGNAARVAVQIGCLPPICVLLVPKNTKQKRESAPNVNGNFL